MTDDYDVYDEDEELRDTIRAHLEGRLNYFDYVQTLMMLGKSEDDVKDDVERIRAEIEAENTQGEAPQTEDADDGIESSSEEPPEADDGIESSSEEDVLEDSPAPEPVLKPGERICGECGRIISADREVTIMINGKPACESCFAEFTGLPVSETEDPIGGTDGEDPQDGEYAEDDQDDGDSEDYTADPTDYEDDGEDYAAELTADGHMGVREAPEPDPEPETEVEDYGMGVDPDEIEAETPGTPVEEPETEPETLETGPEPAEEPAETPEPAEEPVEEPETGPEPEPPARDEATERFIESVYEDEPEDARAKSGRPNPVAAIGGVFAKLPKKPVKRHPKKQSEDGSDGDPDGEPRKKAKEIDPESFRGRFDRWYKINFQNYVKLRTLSRNADTGEFRMDLELIKRKDLPRMAVAVTGEKHTFALDRIRRTEWYYMNHDKSMVPPWEAQFTASDAALWMMSDKIDNALSINWTQQTSTLADNKKIILIAALGILGIVLFFMMRHR